VIVVDLIEDYNDTASDRYGTSKIDGARLHLPSGFSFHSIHYSYLPSHYKERWDYKETESSYHILYFRRYFWRIPKTICKVPICYKWGYNI
jgi:hypothetical protein